MTIHPSGALDMLTLRIALAAAMSTLMLACMGRQEREGVLATLADAALPVSHVERCLDLESFDAEESNSRGCQGRAADTLVTVATAPGDSRVVRVTKLWKSAMVAEELEARRADIAHRYGAAEQVCIGSQAAPGYRWQRDGFYVTLVGDSSAGELELSYREGTPRFQQSCPDRMPQPGMEER